MVEWVETTRDALARLMKLRNHRELAIVIRSAIRAGRVSELSKSLREIERSLFSERWGMFRGILFRALELEHVSGIDRDPVDLIEEAGKFLEPEKVHDVALKILEDQARRRITYFLDVDRLVESRYARVVPSVLAARQEEINSVCGTGSIDPQALARTYYGFLYFTSHVRDPTINIDDLTNFISTLGLTLARPCTGEMHLDSNDVSFEDVSDGTALILKLLLELTDWDSWKRAQAAERLGQIGDPRAVENLCRALHDTYPWVRQAVAKALGNIGLDTCVRPLASALWDWDVGVRRRAMESLVLIGEPAVPVLREIATGSWKLHRDEVIRRIRRGHSRILDVMAIVTEDVESAARGLAEHALAEIEDARCQSKSANS